MKNRRSGLSILCLAAFLGCLNGLEADTVLVDYDFDSLSAGALAGQDNWFLANSAISPLISANNASTGYSDSTNAVGRPTTSTSGAVVKNSTLFNGSLSSSSILTLSVDIYAGGNGSVNLFGIGGSSYGGGTNGPNLSASFGIFSGIFAVRPENNGTLANAQTSAGTNVVATTGHWYNVESVWDLSTGTATLAYKDLTAGDTSYTTLYFDAAQTQTTTSLVNGTPLNPATWSTVYLREGNASNGLGLMDNLSVTVAPEPSAAALAGAGLFMVAAASLRKVRRRA